MKNKKIKIFTLTLLTVFIAFSGFIWHYYTQKLGLLNQNMGTVDKELTEEELREKYATLLDEDEYFKSDDLLNILLIGTDERSPEFSDDARADACMLFSLNKKTMQVKLISFERGMGVPVLDDAYKGQYDWLTHTFKYGGADLMMKEIRECFKIDVTHYVRVNFEAFEKAIDCIGGVDLYLSELEAKGLNGQVYTNATTRTTVHEGLNHLDGYDALQYARIRFIDSDWNRIERQRKVVDRAIQQTKNLSLKELDNLLNEVLPLVQTNFTRKEITSLLPLSLKYKDITIEQMTVPAKGTYGNMVGMNNRNMFKVDFEKNAQIIKDFISPKEPQKVDSQNSSGAQTSNSQNNKK